MGVDLRRLHIHAHLIPAFGIFRDNVPGKATPEVPLFRSSSQNPSALALHLKFFHVPKCQLAIHSLTKNSPILEIQPIRKVRKPQAKSQTVDD
jgi:hypothetical protein